MAECCDRQWGEWVLSEGGVPTVAITLFHNLLLHCRLQFTCLKTMNRGLLVLTWLSPDVGINSKAVHNPGKEAGYGFS